MCVSSTGVSDVTANPILQFLNLFRRTALLHESQEQSDAQLLGRFVGGDGVALETLVRRHAAMVWGVCRRNVSHNEDAEDAFQAAFLVLLRKAASLRSPELLANWLYGVAYKTACKARQTAAKRGAREQQGTTMPESPAKPPEDGFGTELLALLDRELNGLPEKYRTAIVLCELQGRTIRDVAQELRVKEGTVASRLARGREMLAQRMIRHGAGLSAVTVAAVCSQQSASGALPTALLTRTIDAVRLMAAEQPVMAGLLSAEASTLSEAVLHAMAPTKWKAASVVLLLAALTVGGGAVAYHSLSDQPSKAEQPPPEDPNPKMYGTAAGATSFAKTYLYEHNGLGLMPGGEKLSPAWPSREFKATLDPDTHQWTITGAYRWDVVRRDGGGNTKVLMDLENIEPRIFDRVPALEGWDKEYVFCEKEWKLVLSYDPSAHAYGIQKAEGFDGQGREDWRPARTDDLGKWLQGRYTKPRRSPTQTALRLVLDGPGATKLGLEPKYSYGNKNMTVEQNSGFLGDRRNVEFIGLDGRRYYELRYAEAVPGCEGVHVTIDDPVTFDDPVGGALTKRWTLVFGAPFRHTLKVGEYGGAGPLRWVLDHNRNAYPRPWIAINHLINPGPVISVSLMPFNKAVQPTLIAASPPWSFGGDSGEFVVHEIELKDQEVMRLAIDFITDTGYGLPSAKKRTKGIGKSEPGLRRIVRGSLRYKSQLELSIPELDRDAGE
jgi:RNA polymerase sigma factor (sigma-70 family)